jgi:hypothetical protein
MIGVDRTECPQRPVGDVRREPAYHRILDGTVQDRDGRKGQLWPLALIRSADRVPAEYSAKHFYRLMYPQVCSIMLSQHPVHTHFEKTRAQAGGQCAP